MIRASELFGIAKPPGRGEHISLLRRLLLFWPCRIWVWMRLRKPEKAQEASFAAAEHTRITKPPDRGDAALFRRLFRSFFAKKIPPAVPGVS